MALLTGGFSNEGQYSSLRRTKRNFPYTEHIDAACNDKINNLPLGFPGESIVKESTYEVNGERHAFSHLFLFTEKPEEILLTSYEIPEGNNKVGFSYKNMTTVDSLCLKFSERFTPALFREKNSVWEGGSINMFTPVVKFRLPGHFSKDYLEVSETIEVNGKKTFGYDQPILYKRMPE